MMTKVFFAVSQHQNHFHTLRTANHVPVTQSPVTPVKSNNMKKSRAGPDRVIVEKSSRCMP